jgi:hypothetical protein
VEGSEERGRAAKEDREGSKDREGREREREGRERGKEERGKEERKAKPSEEWKKKTKKEGSALREGELGADVGPWRREPCITLF